MELKAGAAVHGEHQDVWGARKLRVVVAIDLVCFGARVTWLAYHWVLSDVAGTPDILMLPDNASYAPQPTCRAAW